MKKPLTLNCERCNKEVLAKSDDYSYMVCSNRALNTVTTIHLCQNCYNKFLAFMEEEEYEDSNNSCGSVE